MDSDLPQLKRRLDEHSSQRFVEASGRRAAFLGTERAGGEVWIWPLKILHGLAASVRLPGVREPIEVSALPGTVRVEPHKVTFDVRHPLLRLQQTVFAPLDRAGIVFLFELDCESDATLELSWTSDFRPMWPAGLGGQIAGVDRASGALHLTEELGRFACWLGSPDALPATAAGDHALAGEPRVQIPVSPQRAARGPIVFAIAGAQCEAEPLPEAARRGAAEAARGHSRTRAVLARAEAEWSALVADVPGELARLAAHWRSFLARTTALESDDKAADEAFLWAKIAIEKSWVEVDGLGRGIVAGLGPSGTGERPGFGWFFDGDALVASRAMSGYGDFEGARDVLRFAASHQREDGKMMHELVLSSALIDWEGDYPYAYYKAGNTPGFWACWSHYYAASGDGELARELAPSLVRAWEFAESCVDERGFFSNELAGLGAVEAGAVVERIRSEIFTQGIWMSAVRAARRGPPVQARAREHARRARRAFESFYCQELERYGFAQLRDGGLDRERTAYPGHPLSRGFGQLDRARRAALALLDGSLSTDWGMRHFADDSPRYDADDYNTGSVFPYLTNFTVLALYRLGYSAPAHAALRALVELTHWSGLGFVPEHLAGDRARTTERSVPHQAFSSAAVVQSTVFGAWGVACAAERHFVRIAPTLSPFAERAALRRLRVGTSTLEIEMERTRGPKDTEWTVRLSLVNGDPVRVSVRPRIPLGSELLEVHQDGERVETPHVATRGGALELCAPTLRVGDSSEARFRYRSGPDLDLSEALRPGAESRRLRPQQIEASQTGRVRYVLSGRRGERYEVGCVCDGEWRFLLDGAALECDPQGRLEVSVPAGAGDWGTLQLDAERIA